MNSIIISIKSKLRVEKTWLIDLPQNVINFLLDDILVLFLLKEHVTKEQVRKNVWSLNENHVDICNYVKKNLPEIILKYEVTLYFDCVKFFIFFFF